MPPLRTLIHPLYPWRFLKSRILRWWLNRHPNERAVHLFPAGHFYSPLLDIESLTSGSTSLPHDDVQWWENVSLRDSEQEALYRELLSDPERFDFPNLPDGTCRYHHDNGWFPLSDALVLSGLLRRERPKRIVEVGAGYSTAVMLDTIERSDLKTKITCLEPHPERLRKLLSASDVDSLELIRQPVQDVPMDKFTTLENGDVLFIDSSHVAKIGSDVSFLLLRVLPRLKSGVWVHIHDIFYPMTYPVDWIREGRAWNESLFLRAFLEGNDGYHLRAFNSYASKAFPPGFWDSASNFLENGGCSFWMQRQ